MFLKRANSSFRTRRSCSGVNCTQLLSLEGGGGGERGKGEGKGERGKGEGKEE